MGEYREVRLLEHAMKVMGKVLERRIWKGIDVDEMQFGFYGRKGNSRCSAHCKGIARGIPR